MNVFTSCPLIVCCYFIDAIGYGHTIPGVVSTDIFTDADIAVALNPYGNPLLKYVAARAVVTLRPLHVRLWVYFVQHHIWHAVRGGAGHLVEAAVHARSGCVGPWYRAVHAADGPNPFL